MKTLLTRSDLVAQIAALGVNSGDRLLVHTRMSSLGYVPGSQQAVIEALIQAVGETGTIVMPTYSGDLSDPAEWRYPPVPEEWIERIRDEMPAYDPQKTPTRRMGSIPEYFRHVPGAVRSDHPQSSFTALGPDAARIVGGHCLDMRFGPESPLARLYDLGGKTLLLGSPFDTNSMLYLTEHRVPWKVTVSKRAPIMSDGKKIWKDYADLAYTCDWFDDVALYLIEQGIAHRGTVGDAACYVFPIRESVEAAVQWRIDRHSK